jgi:hypothetical protein
MNSSRQKATSRLPAIVSAVVPGLVVGLSFFSVFSYGSFVLTQSIESLSAVEKYIRYATVAISVLVTSLAILKCADVFSADTFEGNGNAGWFSSIASELRIALRLSYVLVVSNVLALLFHNVPVSWLQTHTIPVLGADILGWHDLITFGVILTACVGYLYYQDTLSNQPWLRYLVYLPLSVTFFVIVAVFLSMITTSSHYLHLAFIAFPLWLLGAIIYCRIVAWVSSRK